MAGQAGGDRRRAPVATPSPNSTRSPIVVAAASARARGMRPGDRMLLQLPNSSRSSPSPSFGVVARRRGAGDVPVRAPLRGAGPLRRGERRGRPRSSRCGGRLRLPRDGRSTLQRNIPSCVTCSCDGDPGPFVSWSALTAPATVGDPPPAFEPSTPAQPAVLLVSGGTTGLPKLISTDPRRLRLHTAVASAQACEMVQRRTSTWWCCPPGTTSRWACPGLLGAMTVGASTVFTADPSPENGVRPDRQVRGDR